MILDRLENGAYMAGVQRLLRNINEKAKFMLSSNHSVNLCVLVSAVNASVMIFFGVIERLYIFLFFQSPAGSFILTCESHNEAFSNHSLECTLRSYSCSENWISKSDSA